MMVLARRLATGLIAAALTALWAVLIMRIDPHALAFYIAMPSLAVTLGLGFAGLAFLIGIAPGQSDPRSCPSQANQISSATAVTVTL